MDDALAMGVIQGGAYLAGNGQNVLQRCRAAVVERSAVDQLCYDKGRTLCLARVIQAYNVGVVEFGGSLGLVQQAGATLIAHRHGRIDLDRHIAVQHKIVGTVDDPCTAAAQFLIEAIAVIQDGRLHGHEARSFGRGQIAFCLDGLI